MVGRTSRSSLHSSATVLFMSAVLAAAALIWSGSGELSARTRTIGADRIVSVESLPDADMCSMPGAEEVSLSAAIRAVESLPSGGAPVCALPQSAGASRQAPSAPAHIVGGPGTPYQARTRAGQINKPPLHYIKDPYAAWSSIAVNVENDMIVMTDENLFRIVEYSRRDNTPPNAPLTEPRRVIGGDNTRTEMLCGTYIDPKTLEIYVTNNDTQDFMPVFSREARGNAVPDRLLATPHQAWGIAADEVRQELYLTVQSSGAVVVYRKAAAGTEAPLRILEGSATELADPHGIAIDQKDDLMIVANHGNRRMSSGSMPRPQDEWRRLWQDSMSADAELHSFVSLYQGGQSYGRFEQPSINIYQRGASNNTPPLRVIKGPRTQLNWPTHVGVHEERGEIFVANDADDAVLVFKISDSGDVAPTRVLKGPRTLVKNPTGLAVDAKSNELWVASMGNFTAAAFPITANGNTQPLRVIRGGPTGGAGLMIGNPGAVGYDKKRQEILVPN